jgi:sulfate transport system ATP-binding protein
MKISVENITKKFHEFVALDSVSLEIASGELVALLGPSGCGKTTLMRIIAGLEKPDAGTVLLNDSAVTGARIQERGVGFVFQHYALFKHMTVFDNVAFGLSVRPRKYRPSKAEIKERVMELLKLVHLDAFFDRYPSQLSGGQRQRVALARALAVEPQFLLLDEPFGALDAKVRQELRRWMRRLHDDMHITTVFVTHDQAEAMEVADRVVVMNRGKIEQVGSPEEVYHNPVNSFVYDFLDSYNIFDGWQDASGSVHLGDGVESGDPESVKPIKVYARPHEIQISTIDDCLVESKVERKEFVEARIARINPTGSLVKIELERLSGDLIHVEISRGMLESMSLKKGDPVGVRPIEMRIFP